MASVFDKDIAQTLCNIEVPNRVKFSPDGTNVVYSTTLHFGHRTGKNSTSTIWLAASSKPGSSRQLTSGTTNDTLPSWHPDGNQIAFVSDRSKPGKSSAIWMLRLDGGDPVAITKAENAEKISFFAFSPDGSTIAYVSADEKSEERKKKEEDETPDPEVWGERWDYARLRLVDVKSKKVKELVGGQRHIDRMHWSPDGNNLVFSSTENLEVEEGAQTGTTISSVNVDSGEVRDLYTVMGSPGKPTWAPDGKIYFTCSRPVHLACAAQAVYSIDPSEAKPELTSVACGIDDEAAELVVAGGKLLVRRNARVSTAIGEISGHDIFKRDTKIRACDVYFDKNDGKPAVATVLSDINNPYEVFVMKDGTDDIKLSGHGSELKDRSFGSATVLTSQSSDGQEELDGLYLVPTAKCDTNGKPKEPLPTFVMVHGGPTDHSCSSFDAFYFHWSPYILSQGYGILLPQYRGSSARGEKFASYTQPGVGKYDYEDVISITDDAIKKGFADSKRLMVGGWSQGGYLSYLCSARNGLHGLGWRFNATVAGAGISDWDSLTLESDVGALWEPEMMGGRPPWTLKKTDTNGRQGSALWEVSNAVEESHRRGEMVIPPMLILHGKNDQRCPLPQAEGYRRALRAHGLPCEYVVYPGEGHIIMAQRFWMDMLERIGRWCHDYIGPGIGKA